MVDPLRLGGGIDKVEGGGIGASEATRDRFRLGIRRDCIEGEDAGVPSAVLDAAFRRLLDARAGGITGAGACDVEEARGDVGLAGDLIELRREVGLGMFCGIDKGEGV